MRVEMAGMRRDAEHYSRQEHVELEKRYCELTDLLYHKQTQLESMASEKAALEFQLEKSLKQFHKVQVEAERGRVARRPASSWEEDTDIKALDTVLDNTVQNQGSSSTSSTHGNSKSAVTKGCEASRFRSYACN